MSHFMASELYSIKGVNDLSNWITLEKRTGLLIFSLLSLFFFFILRVKIDFLGSIRNYLSLTQYHSKTDFYILFYL